MALKPKPKSTALVDRAHAALVDAYRTNVAPCPRCSSLARDSRLPAEFVMPTIQSPFAPRAVDGSGPCCLDCGAADTVVRSTRRGIDFMTEGPFVVVYAGGYRIEVDRMRATCPGHLDPSIYKLLDAWGLDGKTAHNAPANDACDRLNQLVRQGRIVYDEPKDTSRPPASRR